MKAQKLLNENNRQVNTVDWHGERTIDIAYQGKYFCSVSRNRVFNKNDGSIISIAPISTPESATTIPPLEDKMNE